MSLKLAANISGILLIITGLLIKLAPRATDQMGGNIIIALSVVVLLVANLAEGRFARLAQWALFAPVILFVLYLIVRRLF